MKLEKKKLTIIKLGLHFFFRLTSLPFGECEFKEYKIALRYFEQIKDDETCSFFSSFLKKRLNPSRGSFLFFIF